MVLVCLLTLVHISKTDNEEKNRKAIDAYNILQSRNVPVLFDDRENISIGVKIKDSKIVGTPYVVVFGKTLDDGYVEIENNKTGVKTNITIEELINFFDTLNINKNINPTNNPHAVDISIFCCI